MNKKLLINILLVLFFLNSNSFSKESSYFIEGIKHFNKKEFDKSKIYFERDIRLPSYPQTRASALGGSAGALASRSASRAPRARCARRSSRGTAACTSTSTPSRCAVSRPCCAVTPSCSARRHPRALCTARAFPRGRWSTSYVFLNTGNTGTQVYFRYNCAGTGILPGIRFYYFLFIFRR